MLNEESIFLVEVMLLFYALLGEKTVLFLN